MIGVAIAGGAFFQEVNVMIFIHFDGLTGGAAEFMHMTIAGISAEFDFVNVAAFAGNGFAGYRGKTMAVGIFTASGNFYTALDFMDVLFRFTMLSIF